MNESDFPEDTTFGVIGICGANCNLVARILKDRGFDVIGTDMSSGDDCRFKKSLEGIYKIIRVEHDLSVVNNSFTSRIELEDKLKSIQAKEKTANYPKEIKIEI